jgi:hypothetical protein
MGTTRMVMLATFVTLGIYDVWVCSSGDDSASISQFIVDFVNISPVGYGVCCILLGHFGFPMTSKFKTTKPKDL